MYEDFLNLARQIDLLEDNINDALEADDFDNAGKYSVQKQQKVHEIVDLYVELSKNNAPQLDVLTAYMHDLMDNEREQLELLEAEREKVRKELINISKGNRGGSAYRQVRGYAVPNHQMDPRLKKPR